MKFLPIMSLMLLFSLDLFAIETLNRFSHLSSHAFSRSNSKGDDQKLCIEIEEAKINLRAFMIAEQHYENETINLAVESLKWLDNKESQALFNEYSKNSPGFHTDIVRVRQCAPSADCAYGYAIRCDGEIERWGWSE